MPILSTIPAMPGMVSVAPSEAITPSRMMIFRSSAMFAIDAGQQVVDEHENCHCDQCR
jgi:hypothetical protein